MPEQDDISTAQDAPTDVTLIDTSLRLIPYNKTRGGLSFPPPDKLIMRDETGQPWSVYIDPMGNLRTERQSSAANSLIEPSIDLGEVEENKLLTSHANHGGHRIGNSADHDIA